MGGSIATSMFESNLRYIASQRSVQYRTATLKNAYSSKEGIVFDIFSELIGLFLFLAVVDPELAGCRQMLKRQGAPLRPQNETPTVSHIQWQI